MTQNLKLKTQSFLFVLVFIILNMFACTSDIEMEQPAYTPKITVDGWIESNSYARIYLTLSSPFLTEYDSASVRNSMLNYAKITLLNSRGDSEILTLFKDNSYFPPYVYRSISIRGEAGLSYQIKIEVSGQTLTSTTTIPAAPVIKHCYMVNKTDTTGIITVEVQPDKLKDTYLFLQTKSIKADKNFHPCLPEVLALKKDSLPRSIELYRNGEFNLISSELIDSSKVVFYSHYPRNVFAISDTVLVKVGTIDNDSYEVLNSIFNDQDNKSNPVAFNGNAIKSNINGGIGHWTGVALAPVQVIFEH